MSGARCGHVGDLHHIEKRGGTGQHVLAAAGRGGKDGVIAAGERDEERGSRFRQPFCQRAAFRQKDTADACKGCSRLRCGPGVLARDQNIHLTADLQRGAQGTGAVFGQGGIVVVGKEKNGHVVVSRVQMTAASVFSLSRSSATVASLMPVARVPGSSTRRTRRRGAMSTPSSSGVCWTSGFFLAFMMLGRLA